MKVDDETKALMEFYRDINWAEVIRRAVRRRLEQEEMLRQPFDKRRALQAVREMERLRAKTSGRWSGVEEIRRWREVRR